MVDIILYFQIHQPLRLRRYSIFDSDADYFDTLANRRYTREIAARSYIPATQVLLELARQYGSAFRVALSVTSTALEQCFDDAPEVVALLKELAGTGSVEFLGETSHHSLGCLYSPDEFAAQVKLHSRTMANMFGCKPTIFRNTNLIYSNEVGRLVAGLNFQAAITEGWEGALGNRSPGHVYKAAREPLNLLLRHYRLSEDWSLRFSAHDWANWPLLADKYAQWLHNTGAAGEYCLLGMDYETFGERHSAASGIFDFLRALPRFVIEHGDRFSLPSEVIKSHKPVAELSVPRNICWTDTQRDLSPWLGNAMQANALQELYRLEKPIKDSADPVLLSTWRKLSSSDHFLYMNTRFFGDVNTPSFSMYESPYDAYMNYMSVLDA
ncbi:MAG: glycoside hydrolase family 57 protein, partial [Phycisphaerae bacterium]